MESSFSPDNLKSICMQPYTSNLPKFSLKHGMHIHQVSVYIPTKFISNSILPADTPPLRRQAFSGGMSESIFTMLLMSTTVYSLKLETLRKLYTVFPLESVILLVPSLIPGWTCVGNLQHMLLFSDSQSMHSPQLGRNTGTTKSPSLTSSTFSPTLSTTL